MVGSTAGEQRGESSSRAGSSAVESIPIFTTRTSLRGAVCGLGSRPACTQNEGSLQPLFLPSRWPMGCSSSLRGGAPFAASLRGVACEVKEGPSLPAARPMQDLLPSFDPIGGATGGGLASVAASGACEGRWSSMLEPRGELACTAGWAWMRLVWLVACTPRKKWADAYQAARKKRHGRRGQTQERRLLKGSRLVAGEDWTLEGCARAS